MKQIGDRVGDKYVLLGLLGEGGMGRVFEARNQHTGRRVALKMLQAEHAHNATVLERFLREARAADGTTTPKVIDFGIVRLLESVPELQRRTHQGAALGTPAYMSPEQCAGVADIDPRADVWSLGVVLYQMLSGRLPYEAPTANLLLAKVLYEDPTPLGTYAPSLPPDLVAVVERALTRDRDRRTPSVALLREALLACSIEPSTPAVTAEERPAVTAKTPVPAPSSLGTARRPRGPLLVVAGLCLAGLVGAAVRYTAPVRVPAVVIATPPPAPAPHVEAVPAPRETVAPAVVREPATVTAPVPHPTRRPRAIPDASVARRPANPMFDDRYP